MLYEARQVMKKLPPMKGGYLNRFAVGGVWESQCRYRCVSCGSQKRVLEAEVCRACLTVHQSPISRELAVTVPIFRPALRAWRRHDLFLIRRLVASEAALGEMWLWVRE